MRNHLIFNLRTHDSAYKPIYCGGYTTYIYVPISKQYALIFVVILVNSDGWIDNYL